jgi:hypothetical protein
MHSRAWVQMKLETVHGAKYLPCTCMAGGNGKAMRVNSRVGSFPSFWHVAAADIMD